MDLKANDLDYDDDPETKDWPWTQKPQEEDRSSCF